MITGLSIGQPHSVSQGVFKSENKGNIKLFRKENSFSYYCNS